MYKEIITLLSETQEPDETGELIKVVKTKEIYAKLLSVGQKEFYEAMAQGLQPEYKFEIADYLDYTNEKKIIFNNIKYKVLRTYRKGNQLEITVAGDVNKDG